MNRIGEVVSSAQGLVVARCSGAERPDVGDPVVDESLDAVGRVVDVFGPVDRPFVAVSPGHGVVADAMLGAKLYVR